MAKKKSPLKTFKKLIVYTDETQNDRIQALSKGTGATVSVLGRRAFQMYLDAQERKA